LGALSITNRNSDFIKYFAQVGEQLFGLRKMRESGRALLAAGVVFLALGTLLFIVSERITVQVELMPFSLMLIFMLVAGFILFGSGVLMFLLDRYENV